MNPHPRAAHRRGPDEKRDPRSHRFPLNDKLRSRLPGSGPLRWTLLGVIAATVASPFAIGAAIAQKGDNRDVRVPLAAGERNPKKGVLFQSTRIIAKSKGEALKVSNSGRSGGGALVSCASIAGGSAQNRPPCLSAVNRTTGSAFEFRFNGPLGGAFQVGKDLDAQFPSVRPFVTNATGVATGLNADRVDGLNAQDIIDSAVERSSVQVGAQGPQGPQGAQGQRGPSGVAGPQGPAGPGTQAATKSTTGVAELEPVALNSTAPASIGQGTDLLDNQSLILEEGSYIVQVSLRATESGSAAQAARYAVAGLFVDNVLNRTLWTPTVPEQTTLGAMASDTTVITVPASGSLVRVRGVVKTATTTLTDTVVDGSVTVTATKFGPLS